MSALSFYRRGLGFDLAEPNNPERIVGDFLVGKTIGEGSHSKVKLGRKISDPSYLVALKIVNPDYCKSNLVQRELEILRFFGNPKHRHPNVSYLRSIVPNVDYPSKDGSQSRKVTVIVSEYLDAGDLYSYVSSGIALDELSAKAVFQQIVRGLVHLHKHGIVHLDLKPENILLGTNGIVKLTDFGLSEMIPGQEPDSFYGGNSETWNNEKNEVLSTESGVPSFWTTPDENFSISSAREFNSFENSPASKRHSGRKYGYRSKRLQGRKSTNETYDSIRKNSSLVAKSSSFCDLGEAAGVTESGNYLPTDHYSHSIEARPSTEMDLLPSVHDEDERLFAAISSGHTRDFSSYELSPGASFDHIRRGKHGANVKLSQSQSLTNLSSLTRVKSTDSLRSEQTAPPRHCSRPLFVNSRSGTAHYQAPEVHDGDYDGCKADVYSLGVVMHVMLYGVLPFFDDPIDGQEYGQFDSLAETTECGTNSVDCLNDMQGCSFAENDNSSFTANHKNDVQWQPPRMLKCDVSLSEDALDLLRGMLDIDPFSRFSLKDVMRHPWVDASNVQGTMLSVAALVKRRYRHVVRKKRNMALLHKARKRGWSTSQSYYREMVI